MAAPSGYITKPLVSLTGPLTRDAYFAVSSLVATKLTFELVSTGYTGQLHAAWSLDMTPTATYVQLPDSTISPVIGGATGIPANGTGGYTIDVPAGTTIIYASAFTDLTKSVQVFMQIGGNTDAPPGGSGGGDVVTIAGPLGTQTIAASVATTEADGANVTQGLKADSAATNSSGSWSVVALLKGLWAQLQLLIAGQNVGNPNTLLAASSTANDGLYKTGAQKPTKLIGNNGSATTYYLQFFDSLTLPADATTPKAEITVPFGIATSPTENELSLVPNYINFATGLYFAWSSTSGTLTHISGISNLLVRCYGG